MLTDVIDHMINTALRIDAALSAMLGIHRRCYPRGTQRRLQLAIP